MEPVTSRSATTTDVAIIGAGPYGLSIASHLGGRGVTYRIFGYPMSVWRTQMPRDMRLKSEGFASSLSDPQGQFPLREYCREKGIRYADVGEPVHVQTFIAYGLEFQRRFVPNLERKLVVSLREQSGRFELQLEDGETVLARRVIVAVGITHFGYVPPVLSGLPDGYVSHSSSHSDPELLRGREVAIVGAGASALDLAASLHKAGVSVQVIARRSAIRFQYPPGPRSLMERFLHPRTGIGSGMQLLFYAHAPQWFRYLPVSVRLDRVQKTLGPAPPWFTREQVEGKVPFHLGVEIAEAGVKNGRVHLQLRDKEGHVHLLQADHLIAATGYRVDLERLRFLSQDLLQKIRTTDRAPALSAYFESSVPDLHFVGVSSANTFGPLMRFAVGAEYVAPRIARKLARTLGRDRR
jgi:cation diffusion facilitator CzcD-associated flavoprotein CzcO